MKKDGFITLFALIIASLFISCGIILVNTYVCLHNANASDYEKSSIDESAHNIQCVVKYSIFTYSSGIKSKIKQNLLTENVNDRNSMFNKEFSSALRNLNGIIRELEPVDIIDEYMSKGVSFNVSVNEILRTESFYRLDMTMNIKYKKDKIEHRNIYYIFPYLEDMGKKVEVKIKSIE